MAYGRKLVDWITEELKAIFHYIFGKFHSSDHLIFLLLQGYTLDHHVQNVHGIVQSHHDLYRISTPRHSSKAQMEHSHIWHQRFWIFFVFHICSLLRALQSGRFVRLCCFFGHYRHRVQYLCHVLPFSKDPLDYHKRWEVYGHEIIISRNRQFSLPHLYAHAKLNLWWQSILRCAKYHGRLGQSIGYVFFHSCSTLCR